jgi:putative flippase GtrA
LPAGSAGVIRFWQLLQRRHPALKFALVGGTGFIVDACMLMLLYRFLQLDLLLSRTLAFIAAASWNWLLNRLFTFADLELASGKSAEWLRFLASAVVAAVPNLGVFYLLMLLLPETLAWIFFAMCCGILTGYVCNYQLARHWVFRSRERRTGAGQD